MIIQGVTLNGISAYDSSFNSNGALLYLDAGNTASYPGSGTTWTDLSTYENNATLINSPTFTNADTASYFTFNGTNQYAPVTQSKFNVTYTGKTTLFSIKTINANTGNLIYRCLFGGDNLRNFNTYMYHVSGSTWQIHFSSNGQGSISNSFTLTDNEWAVIAVTQTTGGVLTYYVNGQQLGSAQTGVTFSQYLSGGVEAVAKADNYWNGSMGVCAVYGRALNANEIQQNYNALSARYSPVTNNLVAYYNPDLTSSYPGTGTTLFDISGNGLNGTMSNITYTDPYFTYNGTNSQVTIPDNALLEPGSGSWTMEAWVYLSNTGAGTKTILGKFDPGGNSQDVSYSMRISTANAFAQIGDGTGAYVDSTLYTLTINTWTQIVYVWTNGATKTLQTYINGASIGSVNHTLNSILNTPSNLYLGSYNGGEYAQWMNGRIGITRLYNAALTASQVLQNYNANRSTYGI